MTRTTGACIRCQKNKIRVCEELFPLLYSLTLRRVLAYSAFLDQILRVGAQIAWPCPHECFECHAFVLGLLKQSFSGEAS